VKSQLVDQFGRPIDTALLMSEVGGPTVSGVRSIYHSTIATDLTPDRLASIIRSANEGNAIAQLTLAEEMEERELHYQSVLSSRRLAMSSVPPVVVPGSDSAEDMANAQDLEAFLKEAVTSTLAFDLSDAIGKGYAAVEICWDPLTWTPTRLKWRDPRFFRFDHLTGEELRLLDDRDPSYGVPLKPYKWITHTPGLKSGLPVRGGLSRLAAAAYCVKSFVLRDWLAFAEVFGLPLRVGRYGPRATEEDVAKLINAVVNMGTDAAAVIPESMKIEFQEASSATGGGKIFSELADYLDKQMSKGVLGQTMTTDAEGGNYKGEVHERVSEGRTDYDLQRLSGSVSSGLGEPFTFLRHGTPKSGRYPRVVYARPKPANLAMLEKVLPGLIDRGFEVSDEDIRSELGLSAPKAGAKLLRPLQKAAPTAPTSTTAPAIARAAVEDEIDRLRDMALQGWQPQIESIVGPVRELARMSANEKDFLAGLESLRASVDPKAFRDALALAFFKARVVGEQGD
jgi:phage gp29-like protein